GCIALVDGDRSATGCGAQLQAYYACLEEACIDNCSTFGSFVACEEDAAGTACLPFAGTDCALLPEYTICRERMTYEENYLAMASLFCSSGLPNAGPGDGGDAGLYDVRLPDAGGQ